MRRVIRKREGINIILKKLKSQKCCDKCAIRHLERRLQAPSFFNLCESSEKPENNKTPSSEWLMVSGQPLKPEKNKTPPSEWLTVSGQPFWHISTLACMARARQKSAWRHAATIEDELLVPKLKRTNSVVGLSFITIFLCCVLSFLCLVLCSNHIPHDATTLASFHFPSFFYFLLGDAPAPPRNCRKTFARQWRKKWRTSLR